MKRDLQKQVEGEWKNESNGLIVNVTIGEIRQLIENLTKHNNDFIQECLKQLYDLECIDNNGYRNIMSLYQRNKHSKTKS